MPALAAAALVMVGALAALPAGTPSPSAGPAPEVASTPPPPGLDAADALASLLAGVAFGSLAFAHGARGSREGA